MYIPHGRFISYGKNIARGGYFHNGDIAGYPNGLFNV